ncbi:MAG: cell wall-binding repeat-containing protein [Herbiconiux sp.]|nr:cell wall-binding repeat-containing protein [Herbiconiux sp.]
MRLLFTASRVRASVFTLIATSVVVSGSLGGASSSAQASPTKTVSLTTVSSTQPGTSSALSGMSFDRETHRGYVVDYPHDVILVFDLEANAPKVIATIPVDASTIAVDASSHRLYVGQYFPRSVKVFDIDPDSATVNTELASFGIGSMLPGLMAARADGSVLIGNSSTDGVVILDSDDGSTRTVAMPSGVTDIEVDPLSGDALVSSYTAQAVTRITADGSAVAWPLDAHPRAVAIDGGRAFVASEDDTGATRLDVHRVSDGRLLDGPVSVAGRATGLAADAASGLIYLSSSLPFAPSLTVLDAADLSTMAERSDMYLFDATIDRTTGIVYTVESGSGSGSPMRLTGIRATVSPVRGVVRLAGENRYQTAAVVSSDAFAPGVETAYLASGETFPDALSGSAAAGREGAPMLLVSRDRIPSAVADELLRLKPSRIVIVGGRSSVSDLVASEAARYAGAVVRVDGPNRYAVSASISRSTFSSGAPVAYVSSGEGFADALSASAAAGLQSGPVLLVEANRISDDVSTELARLHPARIVVTGGSQTISDAVVAELARRAATTRLAGDDRFSTSAALSAGAFPTTSTVYVASGATFPDALSGAAASISDRAPVLLVGTKTIPDSVARELQRLRPTRIVVLGGPATISVAVENELAAYLAP